MNSRYCYLLLLILFSSCDEGTQHSKLYSRTESLSTITGWSSRWRGNISESKSYIRTYENDSLALALARTELSQLDTITANGNFLEYLLDEEYEVHIVWGSKTRGVIDTFHTAITVWYAHELHSEWRDYIGVLYNYGRHNELALLPLNKGDSIRTIWNVHDADPSQNLIVTRHASDSWYPTEFALLNIRTHQTDSISFTHGEYESEVEDIKNAYFIKNGYVFDLEITQDEGSATYQKSDTLLLK